MPMKLGDVVSVERFMKQAWDLTAIYILKRLSNQQVEFFCTIMFI